MTTIVQLLGTPGGAWGGLERHTLDLLRTLAQRPELSLHLVADAGYARHVPPGVSLHPVDMSRSRRNPLLWWQCRRLLKALRPGVVHAQGAKAAALLSAQAGWLRRDGCVTVGTVHGTKSGHKAYAALDAVVAVSAGIATQLSHPRVEVIANGVAPRAPDASVLAECRRQREAIPGPLLLAVGRLAPVKAFDVLLQAWPREIGAHLLVLGDGPERDNLRRQIEQLRLQDLVTLGGHSTAVSEWLHLADAMIISSHREGFPYVLVEALQAGCPILSTAVNGVSEILPERFLAPPGDVAALHALLLRELPRLAALREAQSSLFARARSELTLVAMADRTLALYVSLRKPEHV